MSETPTLADILSDARQAETPEERVRLLADAASHPDATAETLRQSYLVADEAESMLATRAGLATIRYWQSKATVLRAMHVNRADDADKAKARKAAAAKLHETATAVLGAAAPSSATVGRYLRTLKADDNGRAVVTEDRMAKAAEAMGTDSGPADSSALAILKWLELDAGVIQDSNRGTAKATKAEADAAKAEAKAEADKRTKAKAETAEAIGKAAESKGTVRFGLVTAKALASASDEDLTATVDAIRAEEHRRSVAKAEAKAKAKTQAKDAEAAAKAEAERIKAEAKAEAERIIAEAKATATA